MTDTDTGTGDPRALQELFVRTTGETGVTDTQDEQPVKKVVDAVASQRRTGVLDAGPGADGLEDVIEDPDAT